MAWNVTKKTEERRELRVRCGKCENGWTFLKSAPGDCHVCSRGLACHEHDRAVPCQKCNAECNAVIEEQARYMRQMGFDGGKREAPAKELTFKVSDAFEVFGDRKRKEYSLAVHEKRVADLAGLAKEWEETQRTHPQKAREIEEQMKRLEGLIDGYLNDPHSLKPQHAEIT